MSFSVNTNNAANTALQYLTQTQGQLNQTQSAINSGLKVADARDDGAIYAIAQNQRGAVAGYRTVRASRASAFWLVASLPEVCRTWAENNKAKSVP